jgi:O-antigen ligase
LRSHQTIKFSKTEGMVALNNPVLGRSIDRGIAVGLVATLAWTTWHLGGLWAGAMARSFPVMMVLLAGVIGRRVSIATVPLPSGWWWAMPFLIFLALHGTFWSATPGRSWLDGLNWVWMAAGYGVSLHVMREQWARRIVWLGVAGVTLGLVALACYQRIGDPAWLPMGRTQVPQFLERSGGAFGAPSSLAGWMIVILPLAGALMVGSGGRHRWIRGGAGLLLLGGGAAMLLSYSRGGWIALGAALLLWPLVRDRQAWRIRIRNFVTVALVLGVSGGVIYFSVPLAKARIDLLVSQSGELTRPILWRAAWGNMVAEPWLGTGGGSYEVMLERHRPFRFWDETNWAHNDYLNTLSDYGLLGFLLSFGGIGVVIAASFRRRRAKGWLENEQARRVWSDALAVGLIAMSLGLVIDFHLKIPALSLLVVIALADWQNLVAGQTSATRWDFLSPGFVRSLGGIAAVALVIFGVSVAAPKFEAEGLRFLAREQIDLAAPVEDPEQLRGRILPTLVPLERAVELFPGYERAWSDLAYARALRANWDSGSRRTIGREAEDAARRGLALCDDDWENWVRLGTALDLQGNWAEAGLAFGQAVKIASNSASAWYYQAFHLSLKPAGMPVARAALATCLRLDPWNPDGEALRALFERDRK